MTHILVGFVLTGAIGFVSCNVGTPVTLSLGGGASLIATATFLSCASAPPSPLFALNDLCGAEVLASRV